MSKVVAQNRETFLSRRRLHDRLVPRVVEREFRKFLGCGVIVHGFLRVHCDACGRDRLVAYSCNARGFGSSSEVQPGEESRDLGPGSRTEVEDRPPLLPLRTEIRFVTKDAAEENMTLEAKNLNLYLAIHGTIRGLG